MRRLARSSRIGPVAIFPRQADDPADRSGLRYDAGLLGLGLPLGSPFRWGT